MGLHYVIFLGLHIGTILRFGTVEQEKLILLLKQASFVKAYLNVH